MPAESSQHISDRTARAVARDAMSSTRGEVFRHDRVMTRNSPQIPIISIPDRVASQLGKKAAQYIMRAPAEVRRRVSRLGEKEDVERDLDGAFKRFAVTELNPTHSLHGAELLLSIWENSKVPSILAGLGIVDAGALGFYSNFTTQALKLLTADSARAKRRSFVTAWILSFIDEIPIIGYFANSTRLESGYDLGDALADVPYIEAIRLVLQNEKIDPKIRTNLANAFLKSYNRVPDIKVVEHGIARRFKKQIEKATVAVNTALGPLRGLEDFLGIPLPGIHDALSAGRIVSSLNELASEDPRSAKDRVDKILEVGSTIMSQYEALFKRPEYAQSPLRVRMAILTRRISKRDYMKYESWRHSTEIAKLLKSTETLAQSIVGIPPDNPSN